MQTPNEETKIPTFSDFKEETKGHLHPFSTIHSHIPACCKRMSPLAEAEWQTVKTAPEAKIWHLKWTPWLLPECVDGIIKYHYLRVLTKDQSGNDSPKLLPVKTPPDLPTKEACEQTDKKQS
jgi:hypothetical protein